MRAALLNRTNFYAFGFLALSLGIVGLAQPDWSVWACVLASSIGYALFWKGMLFFSSKIGRFVLATVWFALVEAFHLNWFMADRYVGGFIYAFLPLLFLGLGLQFGLVSLLIKHPRQMSLGRILGVCGGWTLLEWSRLFLLSGFSWDPIGLALSGSEVSLQFASLFGVYGLGFWIVLTNLLGLRLLAFPTVSSGSVWLVVMSFPYLFGVFHLFVHSKAMEKDVSEPVHALLVQNALIPEQKFQIEGSQPFTPFEQWRRMVEMLAPYQGLKTDLVVFSEAVVPYGTWYPLYSVESIKPVFEHFLGKGLPAATREFEGNQFWAQGIANTFDSDLIIGLEDMDYSEQTGKYTAYNAAFLFQPFMTRFQRYEKRVLVPMGEYIPFEWCKKILSKYGIADSYTPGRGATLFQAKDILIGTSICYEETYGYLVRECRKNGAELLINLSNDVWYPKSRLPIVHFYHGRMRAVESGVPLLRCCNTGVTCGVDALGRVVDSLEYESKSSNGAPGVLAVALPRYHYSTFYTQYGDRPIVYSSALFFCWVLATSVLKRKRFMLKELGISLLRKN